MNGSLDIELRRFALQYVFDLGVAGDIEPGEFDPDEYFADVEDPGTWREEDRGTEREDEHVLEQMVRVWSKACYDAVESRLPQLLPLLDEADDDLCFKAIGLLAAFPRCANHTVPALRRLASNPKADSERREYARETIALLDLD